MARAQTLVQLTPDMVAQLDALSSRTGRNRSDLIREALDRYLQIDREAELDRIIVDGYTRHPQDDEGMLTLADANARRLVEAEPWD